MNWYFKSNEIKEKVSPIIIVRKYKRENGIEDMLHSDKIKTAFNSMNYKSLRKIDGLLSKMIHKKFQKLNLNLRYKKTKLSFSIVSKFRNFSSTNLKLERQNDTLSKVIIDKFTNLHKGAK